MSRRPRSGGSEKSPFKSKSYRVVIGGVALVIAVSAALLIFASMRSEPVLQPNAPDANKSVTKSDGRARQIAYEVVNSYPHDQTSFTQGLLWHEGALYESTGQYGQSKLRRLEFPSGKVIKGISLSPELFGEGLARVGNRLIQLTWQSRRGFVYDLNTFGLLEEFRYDTEGWGLTYDGTNLILSDGTSDLFYLDPQSFKAVRRLPVRMNGRPVTELNELEFIEGEVWSNVWQTDMIMRIDPTTGLVTSFLDLEGIRAPSDRAGGDAVLNGIAYDADNKRIFVTGKLWPRIFEIRIKQ